MAPGPRKGRQGPTGTSPGLTKCLLCRSPPVTVTRQTGEARTGRGLPTSPAPTCGPCPLPSSRTSPGAEGGPPRCCPGRPTASRSPTWPTVTSIPRLDAMLAPENSFFRPSAGKRRSGAQPHPSGLPPGPAQYSPGPSASLDPPNKGPAPLTFSGHPVQAIHGVGVAARDRQGARVRPSLPMAPGGGSSPGRAMQLPRGSGDNSA